MFVSNKALWKVFFVPAVFCIMFGVDAQDLRINNVLASASALSRRLGSLTTAQLASGGFAGAAGIYVAYRSGCFDVKENCSAHALPFTPGQENRIQFSAEVQPLRSVVREKFNIGRENKSPISNLHVSSNSLYDLSKQCLEDAQATFFGLPDHVRYGVYAGVGAAVAAGGFWYLDRKRDFSNPGDAFRGAVQSGSYWRASRLVNKVEADIFVQVLGSDTEQSRQMSSFLVRSKIGISDVHELLVDSVQALISRMQKENNINNESLENLFEDARYVQKKILEPAFCYAFENKPGYAGFALEVKSADFMKGLRPDLCSDVLLNKKNQIADSNMLCIAIRRLNLVIDTVALRLEDVLSAQKSQENVLKSQEKALKFLTAVHSVPKCFRSRISTSDVCEANVFSPSTKFDNGDCRAESSNGMPVKNLKFDERVQNPNLDSASAHIAVKNNDLNQVRQLLMRGTNDPKDIVYVLDPQTGAQQEISLLHWYLNSESDPQQIPTVCNAIDSKKMEAMIACFIENNEQGILQLLADSLNNQRLRHQIQQCIDTV